MKTFILLALALAVGLVAAGAIADFRSFDRTKGGYDPPYTGYTGEPTDWSEGTVTAEGFFRDGYVLDVYANCASGMITFGLLGMKIPFRKFSPRAIAVHKPREACAEQGFTPVF